MTLAECAKMLGKSIGTVRILCLAGYLKYDKLPGKTGTYLVDRESARAYRRKLLAGKI